MEGGEIKRENGIAEKRAETERMLRSVESVEEGERIKKNNINNLRSFIDSNQRKKGQRALQNTEDDQLPPLKNKVLRSIKSRNRRIPRKFSNLSSAKRLEHQHQLYRKYLIHLSKIILHIADHKSFFGVIYLEIKNRKE